MVATGKELFFFLFFLDERFCFTRFVGQPQGFRTTVFGSKVFAWLSLSHQNNALSFHSSPHDTVFGSRFSRGCLSLAAKQRPLISFPLISIPSHFILHLMTRSSAQGFPLSRSKATPSHFHFLSFHPSPHDTVFGSRFSRGGLSLAAK